MNTNVLFLTILFLMVNLSAIAQDNQNNLSHLKKIEKYRRMKNGGGMLTVVGGGLAVAGLITIVSSFDLWAYEQSNSYKTGETLFVIGAMCIGPGIPLWIVGARNQRKYRRNTENVSVRLDVNIQNKGLTLRYRF